MTGIIPPQASPAQNLPQLAGGAAPRPAEQQAEVQAQRVPEAARNEDVLNERSPEEARYEAVREAASQQLANNFVVSDTRFTIYKQIQSGQPIFVTRFTSLVDGTVTVVPESNLLADFDSGRILQTSV